MQDIKQVVRNLSDAIIEHMDEIRKYEADDAAIDAKLKEAKHEPYKIVIDIGARECIGYDEKSNQYIECPYSVSASYCKLLSKPMDNYTGGEPISELCYQPSTGRYPRSKHCPFKGKITLTIEG